MISEVEISDIPAGASANWTVSGTAVVTPIIGGGGFRITGNEADIRATLDSFTVTPPLHSGDDFTLQVTVTSLDADGSTATTTLPHIVNVIPVADAPTVTGGNYTTDEDISVFLTGLAGNLVDADNSEVLTFQMTGVDPAASFTTGANQGGGVWAFTAAELAAGLTYNPPPQVHGPFIMSLVSIATETENGSMATNASPVVVTVAPAPDVPVLNNGATNSQRRPDDTLGADL
ncbi:MAG: hypothetical protein U5K75_11780 [Ahrensia sp.]|nr:hypothetical protein [Ahrensia sp.]